MGPPGMKPAESQPFIDALAEVKNNEEWQQFIRKVGSEPKILSPEDTERFVLDQQKIYNDMAERLGIKK